MQYMIFPQGRLPWSSFGYPCDSNEKNESARVKRFIHRCQEKKNSPFAIPVSHRLLQPRDRTAVSGQVAHLVGGDAASLGG